MSDIRVNLKYLEQPYWVDFSLPRYLMFYMGYSPFWYCLKKWNIDEPLTRSSIEMLPVNLYMQILEGITETANEALEENKVTYEKT